MPSARRCYAKFSFLEDESGVSIPAAVPAKERGLGQDYRGCVKSVAS